jgi:signal transduction histidine kinase
MKLRLPSAGQRYSSKEYKAIFETVLIGSFALVAILSALLFVSYWVFHNTYVLDRILICGAALLYLSTTYAAWARKRYEIASNLLIFFYYTIAVIVMFGWGADTAFAHLMLAITIVLAGVLLGIRSILLTTFFSILGMVIAQIAISTGHTPWFDANATATSFGDIAGYSTLLLVLGLISALFDKRTQELHAEEQHANELLEQRVRVHSKEVEYLRLEKADQLYKFAEVGQLSALLLHDISNQLAVLNMDFADLKRQRNKATTKHLEESLTYIEEAVRNASQHLQLGEGIKEFDVLQCIKSSTEISRYREDKESIVINAPMKQQVLLYGEPLRLSHILFILIRNAFEAYDQKTPSKDRKVIIQLDASDKELTIRVIDHGRGIPKESYNKLFNPVFSAKKSGLGIGLFLAKKITESHFDGTLDFNKNVDHTEFILTIPIRASKK